MNVIYGTLYIIIVVIGMRIDQEYRQNWAPIFVSARFDKIDRNCRKKMRKTAISQIFAKCPCWRVFLVGHKEISIDIRIFLRRNIRRGGQFGSKCRDLIG